MTGHRYFAFGLRVESTRPIPALAVSQVDFAGRPDVEISEGEVSAPESFQSISGVKVGVVGEDYFLGIEECGWFQITGGRRIIIQPSPDATPEQVNLYLLGSVFGTLLHQRGTLPFHCNAVEIEGSVILFCGESGAGKSTLAAYFVERGFRLLSDDVCALHFASNGQLVAAPGVARLKLWQDSLELFGLTSEGLTLVPWYSDKFELPLAREALGEPLSVAGLYHLRTTEEGRPPGIYPLKGLEAANSVTANIYRRRLADLMGAAPSYLSFAAKIVDQIPIFTMNRTWGLSHFREEAVAAENHMRRLVSEGGPRRAQSLG
jgi:hypothetical protein